MAIVPRRSSQTMAFGLAVLAIAMAGGPSKVKGAPPRRLPTFAVVAESAERFFHEEFQYRPGEIISRSQVRQLFEELQRIGWTVADQDTIAENVLADDDLLVHDLRTAAGRKFAVQISRYPGAFDRLDRLIRMPTGHSAVRRLVKGPDGYKMLQYMSTTSGGTAMGKMLSDTPKGRDFNKPTGRIYTLAALLAELKRRYDQALRGDERADAAVGARTR